MGGDFKVDRLVLSNNTGRVGGEVLNGKGGVAVGETALDKESGKRNQKKEHRTSMGP